MKLRLMCLVLFLCVTAVIAENFLSSANTESVQQVKSKDIVLRSKKTMADFHSYANTKEVIVKSVHLDLDVDFNKKALQGFAMLTLSNNKAKQLILDTRALNVTKTEASANGIKFSETQFNIGTSDPILGAPLTIQLPANTKQVRVYYSTSEKASGLQWLEPTQTAGKKQPFMFTQSQAIHARSWIPIQDTPQVRVTYTARVRTPKNLLAVMSADNSANTARDGDYTFKMPQAIPAYLIALAVGDLEFKAIGRRTGVYSEPSVVAKAAKEFEDTEKMVIATEKLYGAYRWGRYDILVLPPSFPFGGMENPRMTFATPTILAGDKSLVSLIAHELAHSWSGNLVTNATWRDFWLNEGFTVYLERRILEAVYGRGREEMEASLGRTSLIEEMAGLDERDQILHVDLKGRDPDDGFTGVPYEKGKLFLRHLEETYGRDKFDLFLKSYFNNFAFQSITTEDFYAFLQKNLIEKYPAKKGIVPVDEWIEKPGLPANAPEPKSDAFARVEDSANRWLKGEVELSKIQTASWSTHEWLHFLKSMPADLSANRMAELDRVFKFTQTGNSEKSFQWLMMAIKNKYEAAYARLEEFLTTIGRRKFLKPLYEELVKTEEGRKHAVAIYKRARSSYHPIAVTTIDGIVRWNEG